MIGIEPTTCWLQVSCSTVEPHQHMAGITGLEPVTHWLTVNCSTNSAIFPFISINISKSISGVLYLTIIFLGLLSPISSSDLPTGECEQHPFSPILVLLQVGFTRLSQSPEKRWALTSPFHPYQETWRLFSVALSLRITPTRRYLAPCSMELRLSSRSNMLPAIVWLT